ncbi:hypothetical protein GDO81_001365 [Engystomops pustulosus]|uniref:Uncharacterized protein n=1 Tax=Engystomops pustulosus TaxID=76066 RepID=A0AAV7DBR4_ENGPU|nr:hypothetical protein GDO81_001365 [Engystomops pustulosus]
MTFSLCFCCIRCLSYLKDFAYSMGDIYYAFLKVDGELLMPWHALLTIVLQLKSLDYFSDYKTHPRFCHKKINFHQLKTPGSQIHNPAHLCS